MTGSALARSERAHLPAGAPATQLDFAEMLRRAEVLAKSGLVPKALKDNPKGIVLVGAYGAELGIPLTTSLAQIDVIENRADPCAQLRLALIRAAGHEIRWVETTDERAVIKGRRRENKNDQDAWVTVAWTIEQARKAHLVERWVELRKEVGRWPDGNKKYEIEKFVVGDDRGIYTAEDRALLGLPKAVPDWVQEQLDAAAIKGKENWLSYTADMLRARAAKALSRMEFSDVLAALNVPEWDGDSDLDLDEPLPDRDEAGVAAAADQGSAPGGEEDIQDAEIVPDEGPSQEPPTWKERARAAGVTQADLIRKALEIAGELDIEAPVSLDTITDPQLCIRLDAWLDERSAA